MRTKLCRHCVSYVADDHDEKACAAEHQIEINHKGAAKAREALRAATNREKATP